MRSTEASAINKLASVSPSILKSLSAPDSLNTNEPPSKLLSPVTDILLMTTEPVPLGVIGILPLLAEIILLPFTSKSPPNLGAESHCKQGAAMVALVKQGKH